MTVEEIRRDCDNFPVGMRVLAVDDDPICLKLLETLLRKCQYHVFTVTATSQARMALKMLRENKDRFDLVISDVHMPDMDGFKLLELVGLEMDLPVIMLSANSDPKLVMKGVTHGACDYLVKPIRIEELRNIWQHVLRRKRFDGKNQNNNNKCGDQVRAHQASGEGNGPPLTGNMDQNGKFNRKRKDEEDENDDDNENESDDPSTQKKPRVVWSIELHRKFVGAVNQLGIEKAVPKRILDLMNVDGLTRENVASHLQKYRLYLKRISSVASQQANMAAALGVKDSPFMRIGGSLDGLGDFRTFQQARLSNVALSSSSSPFSSSNGMLGRLNSPAANLNLRNLTQSSSLVQPSQAQNLSNSITSFGRMNLVLSPVTQSPSLFQGIPSSLEMDQKGPANFNTINNLLNGGAPNNPMMLHGIGNQSGHNMNSFNSEPFDVSGSSNLLDPLSTFESSSKMQPNPLLSSNGPYLQNNPIDLFEDSRENYAHSSSNGTFGSFNSSHLPANGVMSPLAQRMDTFVNGRSDSTNLLQQNENEKLVTESRMNSNEDIFLDQPKVQGGFVPQSYDSLDELMNAMIKREQDETISNCGFGFDSYSFGPGM